jgi:hypothetical protein
MRHPLPPDDPHVLWLLGSPAELGRNRITVGEMCVRRYRERQHRPDPAWQIRLRLRQLLETGTYRASPPAWVPSEMPIWDGYVELKGGEELVGLTRDREAEPSFNAATWYRRECLGWTVAPDTDDPRPGVIRIDLATHTVAQYIARIAGDRGLDAARAELRAVIRCRRILPGDADVVKPPRLRWPASLLAQRERLAGAAARAHQPGRARTCTPR